ncbi:hypothetical protein NLJ89_g673 [Agrocybe chaxingu]|uniref:L-ornithine N(5)-monooxygenase [NAD(P)H] n=1 Tax=Agrocybe chaxingu TaxID=84603 RepID=A0A9W8N1I6_9AGAR|nr:hypothetical protein NLJ89_g673 [Agrocybe chaxingu]
MSSSQPENILDLVGLGFGPANIAIAGALVESWQDESKTPTSSKGNVLFIEKYTTFRWHPGMLLTDARMQISFMKDLATLRNPQSPYTFLSYLHSQGRLISFINRGSTIPTRKEYSDYLGWAAKRVQEDGVKVLFGHEIVGIDSIPGDVISVRYRDLLTGEETIVKTRNIIISPGGSPKVPPVVSPVLKHPHVLHSSQYAIFIPKILETLSITSRPLRIAVVGCGQSAAEVTMDLRQRLSDIPSASRHQIDMLIRKGCLKPSDDSPFANEIFDPASTDAWFSLSSKHLRDMKLAEYKLTNYGVVNPRTLENLYEIIYDQRLDERITHRSGAPQHRDEPLIEIKPYSFITSINVEGVDDLKAQEDLLLTPERPIAVDSSRPALSITSENLISSATSEAKYDAVIYATGYERSSWIDILKNSGIGSQFGLDPLTASREPRPVWSIDPPSSAESSPPTSPELGMFSSGVLERPKHQELYISRNYRLLPVGFTSDQKESPVFAPRVYLQGVEEYTHGLSDSLLSVLGVRAGEVVHDIYHHDH